jgi:hypothetical protein
MFNIRVILFLSHYMFRSLKINIRWSSWSTYVVTELLKCNNFFFAFISNSDYTWWRVQVMKLLIMLLSMKITNKILKFVTVVH